MKSLSASLYFMVLTSVLGCAGVKTSSKTLESAKCEKPYVFFDLGETLVDTKTYNFEKIMYMPEARSYLDLLLEKGYPIGLMVNIPESWGSNYEQKLQRTKEFIASKWDSEVEPFSWDDFGDRVLLPKSDSTRKPHPDMFLNAHRIASDAGCPSVFQGEEHSEVLAAKSAGMFEYQVGQQARSFYLPESELEQLISDPQ